MRSILPEDEQLRVAVFTLILFAVVGVAAMVTQCVKEVYSPQPANISKESK